jgi:hypothetical protein
VLATRTRIGRNSLKRKIGWLRACWGLCETCLNLDHEGRAILGCARRPRWLLLNTRSVIRKRWTSASTDELRDKQHQLLHERLFGPMRVHSFSDSCSHLPVIVCRPLVILQVFRDVGEIFSVPPLDHSRRYRRRAVQCLETSFETPGAPTPVFFFLSSNFSRVIPPGLRTFFVVIFLQVFFLYILKRQRERERTALQKGFWGAAVLIPPKRTRSIAYDFKHCIVGK